MLLRLALNLCQSFCLSLLSTGISDMRYCEKFEHRAELRIQVSISMADLGFLIFLASPPGAGSMCMYAIFILLTYWLIVAVIFVLRQSLAMCASATQLLGLLVFVTRQSPGSLQVQHKTSTLKRVVGQLYVHSSLQTSQGFMDRHSFPHTSLPQSKRTG